MAITGQVEADGKTVRITVGPRFDYQCQREFHDAYKNLGEHTTQYVVDLRATQYLDSAALGMLLVLREHAGGDDAVIRLVNVGAELKKILAISRLERLFLVE